MSPAFIAHLAYLFLAVVTTWFWTKQPSLSFYTLQLVALLVLVYFVKNIFFTRQNQEKPGKTIDAIIFTTVVMLLVFSTGGANSPVFFLVYFLLFGLSFLFEPAITVTLSGVLFVFLIQTIKNYQELAAVLSLFLVTPLALLFGQLYVKNLAAAKRIKLFQRKWSEDEKHLENQETNTLFWLTTAFRPKMTEMLDRVSGLMEDIGHLTPTQKTTLKKVRRLSLHLLRGGKKLQRLIDRETDE